MQALLSTPQQAPDPNWYPDIGATHHDPIESKALNEIYDMFLFIYLFYFYFLYRVDNIC